jgi:hypothetical protein
MTQSKTGGPVVNPFKIAGAKPGSGGNDHDQEERHGLIGSQIATPPIPEGPRQ